MSSSSAHQLARARVTRICDSVGETRALRLQLLDKIRRIVPFDAYAWLLTDPETSVGSALVADVPCLPELPRLIRLKYLTALNRWTALGGRSTALLSEATDGDLTRSLVWRELLAAYDVGDVASLVFRDRFGCWGFLDLWRTGAAARFTQDDEGYLAAIVEPVTAALRRGQAKTFIPLGVRDPHPPGPVVLLLSPELALLGQTPETDRYLTALVPPAQGRAPIPASAYNVGAQLLAVEAGVDRNPPTARVHLTDGVWVTLRAARLGSSGTPGTQNIAVSIEETSATDRVTFFGRAFGLSARERELLGHLTAGPDTRELASRMFLSEHTVQDHLKSIFAKTSTHNRRTLLTRALGT